MTPTPPPTPDDKLRDTADWSDLPRDLYVVQVWRDQSGVVWEAKLASVPMALAPEVRYTRAALRPPEPSQDDELASIAEGKTPARIEALAKLQSHLHPTPSPDDAAVLDEYADAFAEWKHIESEYAETSPNYVAAKARFEEASAAVLARMSNRRAVFEACARVAAGSRLYGDNYDLAQSLDQCEEIAAAIRALADKETQSNG